MSGERWIVGLAAMFLGTVLVLHTAVADEFLSRSSASVGISLTVPQKFAVAYSPDIMELSALEPLQVVSQTVPIVIAVPFEDVRLKAIGTGPDGGLTMMDANGLVQGLSTTLFDPDTSHRVDLAAGNGNIYRFGSLDAIPPVLEVDLLGVQDSTADVAMVGVLWIVVSPPC